MHCVLQKRCHSAYNRWSPKSNPMTRSQEALEKRAEKRSVPVEEQRLKDSKKKIHREGYAVTVVTKRVDAGKKSTVVKVMSTQDTDDWICTKCTNKNFHHRETCNRCQDSLISQISAASTQTATSSSMKFSLPILEKFEVAKGPATTAIVTERVNRNWTCLSCKNDNFPTRTECNRCETEKPLSSSSGDSDLVTKSVKLKIPTKVSTADRIVKGRGLISGKSLSWGKQATETELAENKRLREVGFIWRWFQITNSIFFYTINCFNPYMLQGHSCVDTS